MEAYHIETTLAEDGSLTLDGLPFRRSRLVLE